MWFEQQIGLFRGFDLLRRLASKSRLWMLARIGVGPAIEGALLRPDHEVGDQLVAQTVSLLDNCPQLASLGIDRQSAGIAHTGSVGGLATAVGLKSLDGGLH